MINWLSNLYSFSCHHPTIAGAAAKQLQNITLLIIVKPKCLFTKTSFTQQIVIFSFQISFILDFFFCFIKIWNGNIMPFIMISSHLWLIHSYHCLVAGEPLLLPDSGPFLLSIFLCPWTYWNLDASKILHLLVCKVHQMALFFLPYHVSDQLLVLLPGVLSMQDVVMLMWKHLLQVVLKSAVLDLLFQHPTNQEVFFQWQSQEVSIHW